jgi:hypothetical protein
MAQNYNTAHAAPAVGGSAVSAEALAAMIAPTPKPPPKPTPPSKIPVAKPAPKLVQPVAASRPVAPTPFSTTVRSAKSVLAAVGDVLQKRSGSVSVFR